MIPKLPGNTMLESRPDRVSEAHRMMFVCRRKDIAQVQQGMAARPNSIPGR
jgi:hypothetical protein